MTATTCMLCGASPATEGLCADCAARYISSQCARCQSRLLRSRDLEASDLCHECDADRLASALPDAVWAEIDELLKSGSRIHAVVHLREKLDSPPGLYQLLDILDARLRHLRRINPAEHPVPPPPRLPDRGFVLAQARELEQRPLAIEAYWDGDTTGWFLVLTAILADPDGSQPRDHHLAVLREGGDIRIFNGQVPPWPEAAFASEVGQQIARELGVPFYFPSPSEPEDACPRWWQQHDGTPCRQCGVPLLQPSTTPWRGTCYPCHRRDQEASSRREPSP